MKKTNSIYLIYIIICSFLLIPYNLFGQDQRVITGKIIDADTEISLPYAALGLKNNLKGTTTNGNGEFKFIFPASITDDSLIVNYLGYEYKKYHIKNINSHLIIKLTKEIMSLDEFIVLPHPPEYYIKMAVHDIPKNYPITPYQSISYYREQTAENGIDIELNECVFKSYSKDTSNEHQLVLFKKTENELVFMKKKREKEKKKAVKKEKKKKGKDENEEQNEEDFNMIDFFDGPAQILNAANIKQIPPFMDSLQFKDFNYLYERNTTYNGKDAMEIKFSSKKRKGKLKLEGVLYIDKKSNAFVSIEFNGNIRLPAVLKPILFVMGIGLKKPQIAIKKQYQEKNGLWYSKSCKLNIKLDITKKYMFSKNEHSKFSIGQLYNINDIKLDNPKKIAKNKQFDAANKDYAAQVYNDINIKWNQINRVQ